MKLNRLLSNLSATALFALAVIARAVTADAPPAYPDSLHVPNGCHLSTLAYLNRFNAAFPAEKGEALVIAMSNDAGAHWKHTVAVISWHGEAWVRDEYLGTVSLGCSYDQKPASARLGSMAEAALHRQARLAGNNFCATLIPPPDVLSDKERAADVAVAAQKVPFPVTVFWIRSGHREIPLAFFRPNAGQIAVYEPLHGTCLAECSARDDAKVVALVAAKLGFRADSVRAELPATSAVVATR